MKTLINIDDYTFKCMTCGSRMILHRIDEIKKEIILFCEECMENYTHVNGKADFYESLSQEYLFDVKEQIELNSGYKDEILNNCKTNLEKINKLYEILYNE